MACAPVFAWRRPLRMPAAPQYAHVPGACKQGFDLLRVDAARAGGEWDEAVCGFDTEQRCSSPSPPSSSLSYDVSSSPLAGTQRCLLLSNTIVVVVFHLVVTTLQA